LPLAARPGRCSATMGVVCRNADACFSISESPFARLLLPFVRRWSRKCDGRARRPVASG
jgi:hypothetical protein